MQNKTNCYYQSGVEGSVTESGIDFASEAGAGTSWVGDESLGPSTSSGDPGLLTDLDKLWKSGSREDGGDGGWLMLVE